MPGLRHVVLLTFDEATTDGDIEGVIAELRRLPEAIDAIAAYEVGRDAGLAPDNAHLAIVADFASQEDYVTYRDHPTHRALIAEHIAPRLAGRAAVQHERPHAGGDPR